MKRVSLFLIAVVLIAGMMGCQPALDPIFDPFPPPGAPLTYALNISSIAGGSVTATVNEEDTVIGPGETVTIYDIPAGTKVDLLASPDEGYEFVEWVGKPIDGVTTPVVTITVQGYYEITANFELIPTHELTMAADPELGGTAIDVTDESPYAEGTQVSIRAEANLGYRFVNWTSTAGGFDNADEAETTFTMPGEAVNVTANFEVIPMVAAGSEHTVGLTSNGTVSAVGNNESGQCDVGEWIDIVQVAAGGYHTLGLQLDGTLVAAGDDTHGQCNVGDWEDITQITAGEHHTVGLQSNGTVVAVGRNKYGQCSVGEWTDIVQVAAGAFHTVGLKDNATVLAIGRTNEGQCGVGEWIDILQVAAGGYHTVGLKDDGTVVAVGLDDNGQCAVSGWMLN